MWAGNRTKSSARVEEFEALRITREHVGEADGACVC